MTPHDLRELRNFQRFLRLWPEHGFEMAQRPRWQKYLGITPEEVEEFKRKVNGKIQARPRT